MELNASDKHITTGAEAHIAFGWEKPLNTHTRRRTSLVWAGCNLQAAALVEYNAC